MPNFKKLLDELGRIKEEATLELRALVQDKTIPLDERWSAFISSGLGEHLDWIQHFQSLKPKFNNSEQAVDDYLFGEKDRHQTITVDDLYRRLGYVLDDFDGKTSYTAWTKNAQYEKLETVIEQDDLDSFREECLSKFLYSFDYDW